MQIADRKQAKQKALRQGCKHAINGTNTRSQTIDQWHEDELPNALYTAYNEYKHGLARSLELKSELTQTVSFFVFVFVFIHKSQQ